MVDDGRVFSFVDSAGSGFVAGAESGGAGFDVLCGFWSKYRIGVDDVVGQVQVQGRPSLCYRRKQPVGVGSVRCAGPPFTLLGLVSRFGRR